MSPLLKKMRKRLLRKNRFIHYLGYATGEIILIVIGILIALQINNANNDRILRAQANKIYGQLRNEIREDHQELLQVAGTNDYFLRSYAHANQLILHQRTNQIDTLAYLCMTLSQYSDFRRSSSVYQNLVNSGDIRLLDNDQVIAGLQSLEATYEQISKLEEIHLQIIIHELSPVMKGVINYATREVVKPQALYGVEMQNMVIESMFLTKAKDSVYSTALNTIEGLSDLLDDELYPEE